MCAEWFGLVLSLGVAGCLNELASLLADLDLLFRIFVPAQFSFCELCT